jgi:membrane-anchored protein YejM (alkaline phosphatase superfamily)
MLYFYKKNMISKTIFTKKIFIIFLINSVLSLIISMRYFDFVDNVDSIIANIFIILSQIGHFAVLNSIPLFVSVLVFFVSKRILLTKIINIISSSVLIILIKLDTIVFSQFRYHLSPMVFKLAFGKRASDIFQFTNENYITAFLFVVGVIGFQLLLFTLINKISFEDKKIVRIIKISSSTLLTIVLISHLGFAWSDANSYRQITQTKNLFPAYYPLTAEDLFVKLNLVDKNLSKNEISIETESKNINYPLKEINIDTSKTTKKNILIIVIDSWRYDYLTKEITPNIYNFKKNTQEFTNHKSGSNMTTGGIFSMFYGIPATYFDSFTGVNKGPVLIDQLIKQKYDLNILSSSTVENPPFNKNVFTKVSNLELYTIGDTPAERDMNIFNSWTSYIENYNQKNPFFGFLFFDAAHGFDFPKNYKAPFKPYLDMVDYIGLDNDYDAKPLINRYKNCLHYIDNLVGKIILQLNKKDQLKNTIVIITSDHGQEFNDLKKGYWQHGGNFSKYQINTPFILYDSKKAPKKYSHLTLHYDLSPTIMSDYLGTINNTNDYSSGKSLFDTSNRNFFICGYNQKFAIIENKRITNIYTSGIFDVVDNNLNTLNEEPNEDYLIKTIYELKKFYK